jgi:hypothetical protein
MIMRFLYGTELISKFGSLHRKRNRNRIDKFVRMNRRRLVERRLHGFERLEDRALMAVAQTGFSSSSFAANDFTLENFFPPSGTNRLLVVVVSDTNSTDVTSVTFGSTAMTQVLEIHDGVAVDSIWVLPLGTTTSSSISGDITMTRTGAGSGFQFIGALVFNGVSQSTPIGATDSFNSGATSPLTRSIAATSPGDMVFDLLDVFNNSIVPTLTPAGGQSIRLNRFDDVGGFFNAYQATIKPATVPSTSMSWTHNGNGSLYLAMNIIAAPTPIVVNSTVHGTDSNPATTTLVEAIQQANAAPGPDIIQLPSMATFLSDDALFIDANAAGRTMYPQISSNITIQGNGSTLDAMGKNARFFYVGTSGLTLENMNLVGGKAQGGDGAGGNFAGGGGGAGMGGAIFVDGTLASLTIRNTMIANSIARGGIGNISSVIGGPGGGGGGMGGNGDNSGGGGPRSAASGNSGGDGVGGNGGANNGGFGGGGGGGISPSAAGIGGFGGGGGGGWSSLPTYGTGGVGGFGGGGGGTTTPFATPFAAGGTFGGRGGAYNSSGFASGGGGAGLGGAIFNYFGTVKLENVFLVQNSAVGGAGQSINGVGAGSGVGGGIFNYDGTVSLKHVTAARNVVGTDVPANNPGIATGGAIYNYDAPGGSTPSVSISNSVLSNSTYTNATGVEAFNTGAGTIQAIGTNNSSLVTSSTGLTGTVLTADPQLSLLESLSGRILIRPFAGSPVVDAADPANSLPTDAAGNTRPQGAGPDIGAAEGVFDSTVSLTAGTLVVSDTNADAIFAVDPTNGKRMLVSKFNVRGTGPEIANPRGIALDSSNSIYVVNTGPVVAIIKVDPVTGNRTTVSSSTALVGTGPNFVTPSGIAIRSDGKLIISDTGGTNGMAGTDAIFVVDPATGNRTILSDDVTPNTTNALTSPSALLIHSTLGILVSDNATIDAIIKIDGTTGEKTVLSSNTVPNGTNPLSTPIGLAEDTDQSILLVEQFNDQLLRLNPSTGARTVVATFPTADTFDGLAVGTSGIFVTKTSPNPDQIFKVNPLTGALTLAAGNSIGDGVFFGTPNPSTGAITIGFNLGIAVVKAATVTQRRLFYNRSTSVDFGNGSGNPINAIDPTKQALLPGEGTTTANYSNYSRGLNGLIVDIVGPSNLAGISPASFQFATWSTFSDSTPDFVTINPTATVSTFAGGGLNGSDRVKIELLNNAIQNAWLRVTMLADANTGLAANDVFYFGNARFDVTPASPFPSQQVVVNAFDVNLIRARLGQNSGVVSNIFDVDRNGVVNAFDTNAVRSGLGVLSLRAFTAPVSLSMSLGAPDIDSALIDMSWQDEFRLGNNKHRQQKRS